MSYSFINLPPQQISFKKKNKEWRKKHLDWADNRSSITYDLVRKTVLHKKINYDLVNGKLHMDDLKLILNPSDVQAAYIPEKIQHYPIMNSKMNVLRGEEAKRVFDYRVIVTNPNAITEIENNKKEELFARLQEWVQNTAMSEEEANAELEKINYYYNYEWQDLRELRANSLLNHYSKELNFVNIFNKGFTDAMVCGEEIYQCDIVGGEPTLEKINPLKIRIFQAGYSNKIEDADMIVIEDYWSPGKIIDTYYESLTPKDMKYLEDIETLEGRAYHDGMDNIDERFGFVPTMAVTEDFFTTAGDSIFQANAIDTSMPYDIAGNIKVLKVYWKSRRKIKKVKSFDPVTGEEIFNFYSEDYQIDETLGEEETIFFINEAWEGTKIGSDIYVNMRPRPVQYNRLSNPSRCHFGIVGSIYNLNDDKPFSLVDMMKPYNYLYDVVHDRLNVLLANNWGKLIQMDLAKVPKGWDIDKWMYYAKNFNLAIVDSFKEGNYGAATGKLAGGLNNASSGVVDAELGNVIQHNIQLLEYIKNEMSDVSGISRQREGQISASETVGGVERSTLQSSHITEWLFLTHEDVKKRTIEVFLETAKIALKGRSKKFSYILPDNTTKIMEIEGEEFAEADYGLLVDNSKGTQELSQKIDMLAQAALQNQSLNFSTIMKLYNSCSLAEKQRMVEKNEQELMERQQQAQQAEQQAQQEALQAQMAQQQKQLDMQDALNARDNETKILIAQMNNMAKENDDNGENAYQFERTLEEKRREFDEAHKLNRERLNFDREKAKTDAELKRQQIKKQSIKATTKK